jgi:hypothetical protein
MKKILFILAFLLGMQFTYAQVPDDNQPKKEQLEALYTAYITQKLELTPEEAQAFWPIHSEFEKEVRGVDPQLPELDKEQRILDIKKRFEPRFNKVLHNPKRVDRFYKLHGEFRRKLIERIKNRQNINRPRLPQRRV